MAKQKTCIFCGKTYEYCPHCQNDQKYPNWKFNFDSEKCHDLYDVVAGYGMGIKTVEDIKKVLDKYEVTDYTIFSKKLQDKLNELIPQKQDKPENSEKKENSFTHKMKKNNFEKR
jgi:hypothetical protein